MPLNGPNHGWKGREVFDRKHSIHYFFILHPYAINSHSASVSVSHVRQMCKNFLIYIFYFTSMHRCLPLCFSDCESHEADVLVFFIYFFFFTSMRSCLPLCLSDWESHEADVLVFFIYLFFLQPCAVFFHSASMTGTHMK